MALAFDSHLCLRQERPQNLLPCKDCVCYRSMPSPLSSACRALLSIILRIGICSSLKQRNRDLKLSAFSRKVQRSS